MKKILTSISAAGFNYIMFDFIFGFLVDFIGDFDKRSVRSIT